MVSSTLAVVCIALMILVLALNIFGLPGNWVAFALAALWSFAAPGNSLSWTFLLLLIAIGLAGEAAEFFLQAWGSKKYGGSGKGTIGGMIGAFAGAIVGAPFFFGIGAFFGALAGAFVGSLAVELLRGLPNKAAMTAAWGTMVGRFGGSIVKIACGFTMVALAVPRIWESA